MLWTPLLWCSMLLSISQVSSFSFLLSSLILIYSLFLIHRYSRRMRIQKSVVPLMNDSNHSVGRLARLNHSGVYLTRTNWSLSRWLSETSGYSRGTGEDTSGQWRHLLSAWNTLINYISFSWLLYNQHYIKHFLTLWNTLSRCPPSETPTQRFEIRTSRREQVYTWAGTPAGSKHLIILPRGFSLGKKIPLLR